ncbi:helix-turn-helix transcriptional regulator [Bacillus badius]|uniref:helix-turn-helix domain-containing protein n=1 Tax=Bacillaceae TaxID=186817 RepID=UPI00082E32B3|nr:MULTISPECIES: helix-turn-helix transcriptional regulator [Bacillaceae]MED0665603.1 helix-turn-helix transcriptional regulator [Bacillus badius]MED4207009.1 helix-turn-helix transcriptional regulator [Neobacillus mesonae]
MDLDVNPRYGSRIKEQFEEILDTLQEDCIIKEWRYKDPFIETKIEQKRNWFVNVWLKESVQIIPSAEITTFKDEKDVILVEEKAYNTMDLSQMLKGLAKEKVAVTIETVKEKEVSPESISKERKQRNLSILDASKEMGVSSSTLSRYERT